MEELVHQKKIMRYGISSNTFAKNPSEPFNVSIEKCLQIAKSSLYFFPRIIRTVSR